MAAGERQVWGEGTEEQAGAPDQPLLRDLGEAPLSRVPSLSVSASSSTIAVPFRQQNDSLLLHGRAASKTGSPYSSWGPLGLDASLSRGLRQLAGSGCNPLTRQGSGLASEETESGKLGACRESRGLTPTRRCNE